MKELYKIKELENKINQVSKDIEKQEKYIRELAKQQDKEDETLSLLYEERAKFSKKLKILQNKMRGLYAVKLIPHDTVKEFENTEELFLFINNSIKDCIKNKERLHSIVIEINPDRKIKE